MTVILLIIKYIKLVQANTGQETVGAITIKQSTGKLLKHYMPETRNSQSGNDVYEIRCLRLRVYNVCVCACRTVTAAVSPRASYHRRRCLCHRRRSRRAVSTIPVHSPLSSTTPVNALVQSIYFRIAIPSRPGPLSTLFLPAARAQRRTGGGSDVNARRPVISAAVIIHGWPVPGLE